MNSLSPPTPPRRFYKVLLRTKRGRLLSLNGSEAHQQDNDCVRYYRNRWVLPKAEGTPLFVFEGQERALDFVKHWGYERDLVVFSVEVDIAVPIPLGKEGCVFIRPTKKRLQRWWKGWNSKENQDRIPWSHGWTLCGKLRLVKQIL